MNFFKRLFSKNKTLIQCPRCLGKGHVDQEDIKRLKQELRWIPGKCAYCNGKGEVESDMASKVAVNETYLVANLSQTERRRFINGDYRAIEKVKEHLAQTDRFIDDIREMHALWDFNAEQIAEYCLQSAPELSPEIYIERKRALMEYIEKVLA